MIAQLVEKIPSDRIKEIVDKNIIANAVPLASNAYMKFLFVIWHNYVEPEPDEQKIRDTADCSCCLQSVKNNFDAMTDAIVARYKEIQKLESL